MARRRLVSGWAGGCTTGRQMAGWGGCSHALQAALRPLALHLAPLANLFARQVELLGQRPPAPPQCPLLQVPAYARRAGAGGGSSCSSSSGSGESQGRRRQQQQRQLCAAGGHGGGSVPGARVSGGGWDGRSSPADGCSARITCAGLLHDLPAFKAHIPHHPDITLRQPRIALPHPILVLLCRGPPPLDQDEIREAVEQLLLRRAPSALVRLIGKGAYARCAQPSGQGMAVARGRNGWAQWMGTLWPICSSSALAHLARNMLFPASVPPTHPPLHLPPHPPTCSGMRDLFAMLQLPAFCCHLGYGVLEICIVHLFPELKPLFRTLQHGGLEALQPSGTTTAAAV